LNIHNVINAARKSAIVAARDAIHSRILRPELLGFVYRRKKAGMTRAEILAGLNSVSIAFLR
jgi:hypothetical protein